MTREELHELVDIVMDARGKTNQNLGIEIYNGCVFIDWDNQYINSSESYHTFSDFTQAVKDYIKILEK